MTHNLYSSIVRFFRGSKSEESIQASPPISIRLPLELLEEVSNQAFEIGGHRYRSKHLAHLIEIGTKYYRLNSEYISQLPYEQINLITRIHYVFNVLDLRPELVAFRLGHDDSNRVSNWLSGRVTPTFSELTKFGKLYFICSDWLMFGSNENENEFKPFKVINTSLHNWSKLLTELSQQYNDVNPTRINLLRSSDGRVLLNIYYGDELSIKSLMLSNVRLRKLEDVGDTGFSDLISLAVVCKILNEYTSDLFTYSYSIPDEAMDELESGSDLPKKFGIGGQSYVCPWLETIYSAQDLSDVDDSSYWAGANHLFESIQKSKAFLKIWADEDLVNLKKSSIAEIAKKFN